MALKNQQSSALLPLEIIATGVYLPGGAPVYSAELESRYRIPSGWAERYSGVAQRYWAREESCTDMGVKALQQALDRAGMAYNDLDLVVSASATYDHPIPHNACLIQERLSDGKRPVPGFDIDATCLGFIVALDVCSKLLDGKRYKRIGIVCSERASGSLNPADWETFTLLGDAAVAVIIACPDSEDKGRGIVHADLKTFPHAARYNLVEAGGAVLPGHGGPFEETAFYFKMQGPKLLRLALEHLGDFVRNFEKESDVYLNDIQHIIPHQASIAGLKLAQKSLNITDEQYVINLPLYGNTLSCSAGLAFHESLENGRIQRGDYALLIGTGAGFSIGAVLLKY